MDAFCGWFDTQFKGSAENPVTTEVTLTTAPDPTGATHWGQQVGGWVRVCVCVWWGGGRATRATTLPHRAPGTERCSTGTAARPRRR